MAWRLNCFGILFKTKWHHCFSSITLKLVDFVAWTMLINLNWFWWVHQTASLVRLLICKTPYASVELESTRNYGLLRNYDLFIESTLELSIVCSRNLILIINSFSLSAQASRPLFQQFYKSSRERHKSLTAQSGTEIIGSVASRFAASGWWKKPISASSQDRSLSELARLINLSSGERTRGKKAFRAGNRITGLKWLQPISCTNADWLFSRLIRCRWKIVQFSSTRLWLCKHAKPWLEMNARMASKWSIWTAINLASFGSFSRAASAFVGNWNESQQDWFAFAQSNAILEAIWI